MKSIITLMLMTTAFAMDGYKLNGQDLRSILGNQRMMVAKSGDERDTVLLKFEKKNLRLSWTALNLEAQEKNELGKKVKESGQGVMIFNTMTCQDFTSYGGFLGNPDTETVKIIGPSLSFYQTSLGFKTRMDICAKEELPSIIRSLSFTKKAGTNFPLIFGKVDFTLKDNIFSPTSCLPVFAISGIETLYIGFDSSKF